MAEDVLEKPNLQTLPPEILDFVLNHLQRGDLKATRQTSKALCSFSTPRLFDSFTLYPHERSFERLSKIAESPLRHWVRRLEYDTRFRGITERIVRCLQSVWSGDILPAEKKKSIDHAKALDGQKIRAELPMDNLMQLSRLEHSLPQLSNLKHVVVHDHGGPEPGAGGCASIPSFYNELIHETCGKDPHVCLPRGWAEGLCHGVATYTSAVLIAAKRLSQPLENLELKGLSWMLFLELGDWRKYETVFAEVMGRVKVLEFSTQGAELPADTRCLHNLQIMLKAATNLEQLTLGLRNMYDIALTGPDMVDEDTGEPVYSLFKAHVDEYNPVKLPVRLIWSSQLRKLSVTGMICTVKEAKEVLKACAATLQDLHLEHVVLLPEMRDTLLETRHSPRACFVALFRWIQHRLHLKSVSFTGRLTNGGMQCWFVPPETIGVEGLLREKVEKWIITGGVCPLEHVAITPGEFDVHKKTRESTLDDLQRARYRGEEYTGDPSWQMEYWAVETDYESEEDEMDDWDDGFDDEYDDGLGFDDNALPGVFAHTSLVGLLPPFNGVPLL